MTGRDGPDLQMSTPTPPLTASPTSDPAPVGDVSGPSGEPAFPSGLPHKLPPRRRSTSSEPGPDRCSGVFPARLFDRPNSVLVYGPHRSLVNLTLFALATATNPEFEWVEIGEPKDDRPLFDPVQLGWIPEDRVWLVDHPDALRPDDLSANLSLSRTIRSDEPPEILAQITEFLRLPDRSQRILATRPPQGKPGVVAIANAHRVERNFAASRVPSILTVHRNAGFSVLVGYSEAPGTGRKLFDFVFHLDGADQNVADWRKNHLVCERGITSGPLRDSRPVLLDDVPILSGVLSRAMPS
ncbi:MAG: hypothetical protein WBW47_04825 [Thermoplasmata archaeon]